MISFSLFYLGDLGGTIVVFPHAVNDAKLWEAAPGQEGATVDRIAAALHIDPAHARDPDVVIAELEPAKIPDDKRRKYEAELGDVTDLLRQNLENAILDGFQDQHFTIVRRFSLTASPGRRYSLIRID